MKAQVRCRNFELSFTDADVCNPDNYDYADKLWLLHDHGSTVCVVLEDTLQDALDTAVDEGKLNGYLIPSPQSADDDNAASPLDPADYPTLGTEDEEGITRLGNASEPFDIESLGYVELRKPPMSIASLFSAMESERTVLSYHFA